MNGILPILDGKDRILIAVLHWGLGHATRCIPLIQFLIDNKKTVATAGDSESIALLRRAFPKLESFDLPAYNVLYKGDNLISGMIRQAPKLFKTYRKEKEVISEFVKEWDVDVIISDNRFGAFSKVTLNIYLTHQLNIQHSNPIIAKIANLIHKRFIQKFDSCWVPDYSDHRMSGKLSDSSNISIDTYFLGSLTRFQLQLKTEEIDVLVILSGPEPARTILEERLIHLLSSKINKNIAIVRGASGARLVIYADHITVYDIVDQFELQGLIEKSACIICRSGYSTIMDLEKYSRPKYYIPTPGQTEQEYLAKLHEGKNGVLTISQESIGVQDFTAI